MGPYTLIHGINFACSASVVVVCFGQVVYALAMTIASIASVKHREKLKIAVIHLAVSLIASAVAYQWFSNAMGW